MTKVKTFVALDLPLSECPLLLCHVSTLEIQAYSVLAQLHLSTPLLPSLSPPLSSMSSRLPLTSVYSWSHWPLPPATSQICPREVLSEWVGAETEGCFFDINDFTSDLVPASLRGSPAMASLQLFPLSGFSFPCSEGSSSVFPVLSWSSFIFFPGYHVLITSKPVSLADVPLFIQLIYLLPALQAGDDHSQAH